MKKIILYLLKLGIFWVLLFSFNRIIFFIVETDFLKAIPFNKIAESFWYAIPLDVSSACYSMVLPLIFIIIAYISQRKILLKCCKYAVFFFIFLHCSIAYGEAALYTEWQAKLNYEALSHFLHPSEVFRTASFGLMFLFFGLTILFDIFFFWIYNKWIHPKSISAPAVLIKRVWVGISGFIVLGFLIFTGIRGGWKRFPISLSKAYYSKYAILNDAAVNPFWNLMHNFRDAYRSKEHNPYHSMPEAEAKKIVDSLYAVPKDTTIHVLTTQRPNILFFILESWPGDAVHSGTTPLITPVFDSLARQGIYFDSLYATGYVSDQGIPGNLSAFPATSGVSILTEPQKNLHLPGINETLKKAGYQTGFIYGGQLDFGNIRSYIFNKKYDVVKDGMDYPLDVKRSSLGIPDGEMAGRVVKLLNKAKSPFFYCWYTLSTHMPYDIPTNTSLGKVGGDEEKFINTVHYSDSCIGRFINQIKNLPWYKNTLFVFVSDHSHESQINRPMSQNSRHHIPFLLYGDVIKPEWRGKKIDKISSQLDIVSTLLAQLNLPYQQFRWSKNLFNPYIHHFAAYNFFTGAGFVTTNGFVAFDNRFKDFRLLKVKDSTRIPKIYRLAKAFQEAAYHYYMQW